MPEYRAWQTMRLRCTIPTNPAWDDYGGRGITICAGWLESPKKFIDDMGEKPTSKHELDRKDNDKGYWCGTCEECINMGRVANCRWVTRKQNDRNRRSSRFIQFRGETLTLTEWCERLSLPLDAISKRLTAAWSIERTFTTPVRRKAPNGSARAA